MNHHLAVVDLMNQEANKETELSACYQRIEQLERMLRFAANTINILAESLIDNKLPNLAETVHGCVGDIESVLDRRVQ